MGIRPRVKLFFQLINQKLLVMLHLMFMNHSKNQSENVPRLDQCKVLDSELPISNRNGGFLKQLRMLEECEECLRFEARTDLDVQMYQSALRHWKEAGYPYPGEWPDSEFVDGGLRVSPHIRKWMMKWSQPKKFYFNFNLNKNFIILGVSYDHSTGITGRSKIITIWFFILKINFRFRNLPINEKISKSK